MIRLLYGLLLVQSLFDIEVGGILMRLIYPATYFPLLILAMAVCQIVALGLAIRFGKGLGALVRWVQLVSLVALLAALFSGFLFPDVLWMLLLWRIPSLLAGAVYAGVKGPPVARLL